MEWLCVILYVMTLSQILTHLQRRDMWLPKSQILHIFTWEPVFGRIHTFSGLRSVMCLL